MSEGNAKPLSPKDDDHHNVKVKCERCKWKEPVLAMRKELCPVVPRIAEEDECQAMRSRKGATLPTVEELRILKKHISSLP